MSSLSNIQDRKVGAIRRLVRDYLPLFSLSMLGLVAIRIWMQCCLYDRYTSTDSGIVTIVSNLFRVVVIIVFIVVVLNRGLSRFAQNFIARISIIAMMLAAALFLVFDQTGQTQILWTACLLAGFGIAWGAGMWICVYIRMHPGEALLYAFLSLAAGSFFGFFVGLMPIELAYLVAVLMPPISFATYERSQKIMDEREKKGTIVAEKGIRDAGPDTVYHTEPRSTFLRLITGLMLFNFALGVARGYPHGESIALPLVFQAMHQFGIVVLCLLLIIWALGKRGMIKFSLLWNVSVCFVAAGVLLLATLSPSLEPLGATLIVIANTFCTGLLWFSAYDIARHSAYKPYIILGIIWAVHLLAREAGRFMIWAVGPQEPTPILLMASIVFLIAFSMAFLLNDSIPKVRPLFEEFRKQAHPDTLKNRVVNMVNNGGGTILKDGREGEKGDRANSEPIGFERLEKGLSTMKNRYRLTEREVEVVRYLAQGRSKTYVGKKLYISENTVKTYVKNIYQKVGIHSKQQLLDHLEAAQE